MPTLLIAGAIKQADWSPNGTTLAYTTDGRSDPSGIDGLWTVPAAGGPPDLQYVGMHSGHTSVMKFDRAGNPPRILFTLDPEHSASLFADRGWLYALAPGSDSFTPLAPGLFYDLWRSAGPNGRLLALVAGNGREVFTGKRMVVCDLGGISTSCRDLATPAGMETLAPALVTGWHAPRRSSGAGPRPQRVLI